MAKVVSLKEQISGKLQTILGYYIAGTTMLIFLLAIVAIGVFHNRQLEQYEALIATKLSADLTSLVREADSVGNSSVVWTGLTDSTGREVYLEPLLERINRHSAHHIDLLDYRGRDYIISKQSAQSQRLSAAAIQRTIETATVQIELVATSDGHVLLFGLPIVAPFADGVLGIMLSHVNLDRQLRDLNLPSNLEIRYDIQGDASRQANQHTWLTRVADIPIRFDKLAVPLRAEVSQPVWSRVLVALAAVFLLVASGYALFRTLRNWATHFSQVLMDRLDPPVQVAPRAATHGDVNIAKDRTGDEISAMFDAVQSIVLRQRRINQQLKVSSRVFETAAEAILITDKDGCIVDVNAALLRITGYRREEIMGKPAGLLYRQHETSLEGGSIGEAVRRIGEWRGETHVMTREHVQIPVMMAVSSLTDEHQSSLGNVAIISDIREIKQVEARLRELIYQDQLTGLPNYRAFTEFMDQKFQADASGRFALLFIDLDYLKHINDTYGHEQGDQVIVQFAQYLQDVLPKPHFICRRSGDEFIAVLDIDDSSEGLKARLETALPSLAHRVRLSGEHFGQTSFSVGAAAYPEHANNIKDLLVLADSALLFSKESGRSRVTWLDASIIKKLQRRHLLEIKLQDAVQERRVFPHYQPEVDMRTGEVTGFEALARWHDPELGDISPAEFIPIAEEQGLIDAMTVVILENLILDLPLIRARFPDVCVAFNASPMVLSDRRIYNLLAAHINDATVDHSGLILEVTESDLKQDVEEATAQLEAIIDMGVKIAIDDFGVGYSSLSRLAQLPIQKLKIDRSFVSALAEEGNAKVVNSIMALAQALRLEVTAEGVEKAFQRDMLLGLGCHKAQGFLFARPMPLAQVLCLPLRLGTAGDPEQGVVKAEERVV